jgi:hypothetical protein
MTEKSRMHRAHRAAKQEKQAKNVITWIFGALIILGILYAIWTLVIV